MESKKILNIVVIALMMVSSFTLLATSASGQSENVDREVGMSSKFMQTTITNWYELENMTFTGDYVLGNDLDSTTAGYDDVASETANGGKGWSPIGDGNNAFTGTFNGSGYKISGLYINRTGIDKVGMFGSIDVGAEIINVELVGADVSGNDQVGALVGEKNGGTVKNSSATGDVYGVGTYVGGLVGQNNGLLSNSYAAVNTTGSATVGVGGLVGTNVGSLNNTYATGEVNATDYDYVGGLVGQNAGDGTVNNSYATGEVSDAPESAGLVGYNYDGTVRDSYANKETTGQTDLVGDQSGTVTNSSMRNTYEMTWIYDDNTYVDWDMAKDGSKTWLSGDHAIVEDHEGNYGYPALSWQTWQDPSGYQLTINSTDGGSVTRPGEGTITYESGTQVDLVAEADANYNLDRWTGDNGTINDPTLPDTNITMNDNYSITANFTIDQYDLTIDSTNGGNVTQPGENTFTYDQGTQVHLVAEADTSWNFDGWTGDTSEINLPNSPDTYITMNGTYSITANFAMNQYDLTINSTPGGSVTTPGEGTIPYNPGTQVDLVAESDANYHFERWTGDNNSIDDPTSPDTNITMNDNYSITANFAVDQHDLTINSTGGGSVTQPGVGTFNYDHGTQVDLAAEADTDWKFDEWTGDNATVQDTKSNMTSITMNDNYSITVEFEELSGVTYELTISSTSGGTVEEPGEGSFTYSENDEVNLEAVADSGYQFVEWTGDNGTIADTKSNMTSITMNDNYTITAEFEEVSGVTYDLTIGSSSGGSVVDPGEGSFTYSEDTEVNLEAVADSGYEFVEWTGNNGTIADTKANLTTITMNDDYAITAEFEEVSGVTYDLTISSTSGGSVVDPGEGSFTYSENDDVNLEAVANSSYEFVEWTGDNGTVADTKANATTITMDENKNITATFQETVETNTLMLDVDGNGAVEVNGTEVDAPFEKDYEVDASVDLEANASEGWTFTGWTGSVENDLKSITIVMDGDKNITAHFEEVTAEQYNLTINIDGNGTVQVDGQNVDDGWSQEYDVGTNVTLNAIADESYTFSEWTGTAKTGQEITVTVQADMEITAHFEKTGEDDGGDESTDKDEDDSGWLWWLIPLIIVLVIVIALAAWYTQKGGEDEGEEEFSEDFLPEEEMGTGGTESSPKPPEQSTGSKEVPEPENVPEPDEGAEPEGVPEPEDIGEEKDPFEDELFEE
ncbi:MAG: hypothetical protein KGY76_03160 [Candidatus Thermoplasmatota archaeon]|nr:hypothetical protein [Candidatus Thermoplasmatota archaeon]